MSMLTVGSSPDRGMVKPPNWHSSLEAHGQLDYQPPATYLGDEQMLRILGRGQSRYPRSPNWFLWERGALTIVLLKHSEGAYTVVSVINPRMVPACHCLSWCSLILTQVYSRPSSYHSFSPMVCRTSPTWPRVNKRESHWRPIKNVLMRHE